MTEYSRRCPMHPTKDDCAQVVPNGDYFNVKLHGSVHLNHSTGEPEDFEFEDAKDFIETLFKAIPAFVTPLPLGPDIPNPEPVTKPETPQAKFYTHNYFQVMLQGTQFGNYVLVNSPRFGPLDPNQAINLAVHLRLYAEQCENLTISFEELWKEVK